jgi:hypothetical protein
MAQTISDTTYTKGGKTFRTVAKLVKHPRCGIMQHRCTYYIDGVKVNQDSFMAEAQEARMASINWVGA